MSIPMNSLYILFHILFPLCVQVPVPEWVMKEVQVPDADKINLHHLSHSSNLPGRFGSPCANFPLDDIPFAFHLDAFNTRFAKVS